MQKLVFFFLLLSGSLFSQPNKGSCKVAKPVSDATSQSKITFKFLSPIGKPVISRVAFRMNNDTVIQPKIDKKTGLFTMRVAPGTYSFNFYVKFWYDVDSAPIIIKPKANTMVVVKFEAKDIGGESIK